MHFFGIQAPVTHQFSSVEQHRNLVAIAHFCRGICIHIEHIDAGLGCGRQGGKLDQHLLA